MLVKFFPDIRGKVIEHATEGAGHPYIAENKQLLINS